MNETICIHCIHVESILVACRIHPCRVDLGTTTILKYMYQLAKN
jgi:hypothetical protein